MAAALDLTSRDTIAAALRATVLQFGGVDIVVNTAAIYPTPDPSAPAEGVWAQDAADQRDVELRAGAGSGEGAARRRSCPASIVLTSSANAVVPKAAARRTTSARRPSIT